MKKLRIEVSNDLKSGMLDTADYLFNVGMQQYNITSKEIDFILEKCSDEELDIFMLKALSSFTEKKKALQIKNKYLLQLNKAA